MSEDCQKFIPGGFVAGGVQYCAACSQPRHNHPKTAKILLSKQRLSQVIHGKLLTMEDGCLANGRRSDLCQLPPCACMDAAAEAVIEELEAQDGD